MTTRSRAARLIGVDAARGVALIGMMAVHITPRVDSAGNVTAAYQLASGRSAALFAVLAGVGLALASGGADPPRDQALGGVRAATAARALVLLLVGLTLGVLDSGVAVILAYYALLFLVAVPFLGLRAPVLLSLAGICAVATPVISQAIRQRVPRGSLTNPTLESLANPVELVTELTLTGYYPVLTWTAYLFLGLGLGRLNLHAARTQMMLLVGGLIVAVSARLASWLLLETGGMDALRDAGSAGFPMAGQPLDIALQTSFYGTTPTTSWWWLAVAAPHSGAPADLLHTMGTATAVLGLMLLLARGLGTLLLPLVSIGSMTLSLYSLHVLLLATALPRDMSYVLLVHVIVALVIALPWRAFVGRGPLEAAAAQVSGSARLAVVHRARL